MSCRRAFTVRPLRVSRDLAEAIIASQVVFQNWDYTAQGQIAAKLVVPPPSSPPMLIVSDIHYAAYPMNLPSAADLQKRGITRVKVGLENEDLGARSLTEVLERGQPAQQALAARLKSYEEAFASNLERIGQAQVSTMAKFHALMETGASPFHPPLAEATRTIEAPAQPLRSSARLCSMMPRCATASHCSWVSNKGFRPSESSTSRRAW